MSTIFECGGNCNPVVKSPPGPGQWNGRGNSVDSLDSVIVEPHGGKSILFDMGPSPAQAYLVRLVNVPATRVLVSRFYFRYDHDTATAQGAINIFNTNGVPVATISLSWLAVDQLLVRLWHGSGQNFIDFETQLTAKAFHRFDLLVDNRAAICTATLILDGLETRSVSWNNGSIPAAFTTVNVGPRLWPAANGKYWFANVKIDNDPAAFPIGDGASAN